MKISDMLFANAMMGEGGGGGGGSSDFSTAEVTISNDSVYNIYLPCYYDEEGDSGSDVVAPTSGTCYVILYKGTAYGAVNGASPESIVTTGAIEVDDLNLTITGDGTITISA